MSDRIRRLSQELAREPSGLVFLELAEALRGEGQLDLARTVAVRGLERHPHNVDAHDLLARVCADRGELQQAIDEWDVVHRLAPGHIGARKGMAYVLFRVSRLEEARRYLSEAAALDPGDETIVAALAGVEGRLAQRQVDDPAPAVQQDTGHSAGALFADLLGGQELTALLVDGDGLALAGVYLTITGEDVTDAIAAELGGLGEDVGRAVRDLELGQWSALILETEAASVAMAPAARDSLLLVAAGSSVPLGSVRRVLERCMARTGEWLGGAA